MEQIKLSDDDKQRIKRLLPTTANLLSMDADDAADLLVSIYRPGDVRGDGEIIAAALQRDREQTSFADIKKRERSKPDPLGWFSFDCNRCFRDFKSKSPAPKYCGKCKSSLWKTPRTYEVLGGEAPKRKRKALTGKAAAKQRPERIKAERIEKLEKELKYYDDDMKDLLDKISRDSFAEFYSIAQFHFQFFNSIEKRKLLKFELAGLYETEPTEIYYLKRGFLSIEINRFRDMPQKFYELETKEFRAGRLTDFSTREDNERARHWHELNQALKKLNDDLQAEFEALKPPTIEKPSDYYTAKPGDIVTIGRDFYQTFGVYDLNSHLMENGFKTYEKALAFATKNGWLVQQDLPG